MIWHLQRGKEKKPTEINPWLEILSNIAQRYLSTSVHKHICWCDQKNPWRKQSLPALSCSAPILSGAQGMERRMEGDNMSFPIQTALWTCNQLSYWTLLQKQQAHKRCLLKPLVRFKWVDKPCLVPPLLIHSTVINTSSSGQWKQH